MTNSAAGNWERRTKPSNCLKAILIFAVVGLLALCRLTPWPRWIAPAPPGWRTPVAELLLDESDYPDGWYVDFNAPENLFMDPTVNHVDRQLGNPGKGSAYILQSIWRAYTLGDARSKYTELRETPPLVAWFTPSPSDYYVKFQPSTEISFQSKVADEFYVACGWVVWSYCEAVARYHNYVVDLRLPLEASSQGHVEQGLTYTEIEKVLEMMDAKFAAFLTTLSAPTSPP